jgi:hypothetical protein
MKKPEKRKSCEIARECDFCCYNKACDEWEAYHKWNIETNNDYVVGYNDAMQAYEVYHKWDIETNYIKKSELPSEEELKAIFHQFCSGSIDEDGHCNLHSTEFDKVAQTIAKRIKGK